MRFNRHIVFIIVTALVLAFCLSIAACSPSGENQKQGTARNQSVTASALDLDEAIANAKPDDPYVADEVCLSCHGGSYDALEQRTAQYGDSNPHGGTHGWGGVSCNECHIDGSSKPMSENNQCLVCHDWPRDDESLIEHMDL